MIRVQCPAKINLYLKILNKREDGFHNIDSVMQTISLYDYLNIKVEDSETSEIILSGTSTEIPYDKTNLVYKAAQLYLNGLKIQNKRIFVNIEKNIPIAAGLAGGSTDAAGTLYGLNNIFGDILSDNKLHEMCAKLGSDLNVCLAGGRIKCSGRGEIISSEKFEDFPINLIKPINIGISAKEAYSKFSIKVKDKTRENFENDLEWAILEDYPELQYIKNKYPTSIMTGSGSTYFSLSEKFTQEENFWIRNDLKSINFGVIIV